MFCSKCEEEIPRDTGGVECLGCNVVLHFKCSTLKHTTYRAMSEARKDAWRCDVCRLASRVNSDMKKELDELRLSLDELKDKVETYDLTFQAVKVDLQENKNTIISLKDKIQNFSESIKTKDKEINLLNVKIHDLEQLNRKKQLEIHGVAASEGEDLVSVAVAVSLKLGVLCEPSDIEEAYRLPKRWDSEKAAPIVVELRSLVKKSQILKQKKTKLSIKDIVPGANDSTRVSIYEALTSYRKNLLWKAKNRAKETGWKFVWVAPGGMVKARKEEGSRISKISSDEDLAIFDSLEVEQTVEAISQPEA